MLKGVLHCHSTYSDGDFTLAELREIFVREGCRFLCVTDHAEYFDARKLADYRSECEQRSDDRFRLVAGLEYRCANGMHILGFGTTSPIVSTDPQEVIRQIGLDGGVAVIAHPKDDAFAWIESCDVLPNGIETWNSKYDGRYAPRPGTFALLARLKARRPGMTAFFGQDLHWRHQYRGLFTMVECETADAASVVRALGNGAYVGVKEGLTLPSNGDVGPDLLARFARAHSRSQWLRRLIKRAGAWAGGIGIAVPTAMKAQLRRMF
jgi:hypothetical protein